MKWHSQTPATAFLGHHLLAQGSLADVAIACHRALTAGEQSPLLVFRDEDYSVIEVDFRGSEEDVLMRLPHVQAAPVEAPPEESDSAPGRGRPRLGVVAREVTLLPRHWEWLKSQPGGASVALRKLVEQARRESAPQDQRRQAQSTAYRFMSVMAGAYAGFEEASRALFAEDLDAYIRHSDAWPADIRSLARKLAARAIPE